MLIDFMKSCTPVLTDEKEDYIRGLDSLKNHSDSFIGFMPSLVEDFWPIYIMECTKAAKFNTHENDSIYIIPYGANDFWGVSGLSAIMHEWYENDEITIGEQCDLEIKETILG